MKKINILLTVLYIIGLIVSAYTLYQLPVSLMGHRVMDLTQLPQAQPVFNQLYLIMGGVLTLGIAAVVGLWMKHRQSDSLVAAALPTGQESIYQGYEDESEKSDAEVALQIKGIHEIMVGEDNEETAFTKALSLVCHHTEASQAAAYRVRHAEQYSCIELFASFAYHAPEGETVTYRFGEGLAGQVAKHGECLTIDAVPEGYIEIISGLGRATPTHLIILPVKHDDQVVGVVEIASFKEFSEQQKSVLLTTFDQLGLKLLNNDNVSLEEATS